MSIVISDKVRLVMTDADTTNFVYGTNQATEISILKGVAIAHNMLNLKAKATGVSTTPNRVTKAINTGYSGVNLTFSTYLKPITDGANVSSAEKLLWESFSATDTTDTATESTVSFSTGNTNKLRELFFFLILEDGTYYKVSNGVVTSAEVDIDINRIATIKWTILALDMSFSSTADLTGTPKLLTDRIFIRNKLSTIALQINAVTYDLAILKASIALTNSVNLINRLKVGEIFTPSGHYVGDRTTNTKLSFYLDTKSLGSSTLITNLLNYTTLATINTLANATISIGGSSNALNVNVAMPTSKVTLANPTIGLYNTVEIELFPQESVIGAGDEISLEYNN